MPIDIKKLSATKFLKDCIKNYYRELNGAAGNDGSKIAWCTSVGPVELLRGMGFKVYFPENHAAIIGALRKASGYIPKANIEGYSPDICSYLTSDIGAYLNDETALTILYPEMTSVPKPDILVYNTNQCRDVKDWFLFYAKEFAVPCIGIESFHNLNTVSIPVIKAIQTQLEALIPRLEDVLQNRFDIDRFKEVVALSRKCSQIWQEILLTAQNIPSPMTFFDAVTHMGPAVMLRGSQRALDYYQVLLEELNERVDAKIPGVENESARIYWEGMPIWGQLKDLALLFLELKSAVVVSTYCNSWVFDQLDPENPFESMARAYTELFIVRSDREKEKYIRKMVETFQVDGIIFHDAKTCPNNSNTRYGLPNRIARELNMPFSVINGDLNDLRLYSHEQTFTKIEALIEQVLQ